jgi:NADH-quinone oxidoreductase subunit G
MTRCISCTRCVRFITEVAGIPRWARPAAARMRDHLLSGPDARFEPAGQHHRPLPGGRADLKPYAFTARPWELTKTETIDVMDALGSNIRVDTKGREVMRILPRNHDGVNEEWLPTRPALSGTGCAASGWTGPISARTASCGRPAGPRRWRGGAIKGARSSPGLVGDLAPVEAAFALKQLVEGQGGIGRVPHRWREAARGQPLGLCRHGAIEDIDDAKMIMLIGTNPRVEAPVLNARIRKAWRAARRGLIGPAGRSDL